MSSTSVLNSGCRVPAKHSASLRSVAGRYLQGRRGLYALALVVAATGLAFGGAWWGFAAILPLLYALPCAAMMAMCMKGHGGSGQSTDAKPAQTANFIDGPATDEAAPR